MDIQGLSKITHSLTSLQKAAGLDPMRSASFDNMFSNMIGNANNNDQNPLKVSTVTSSNAGLPNFDNLVSGFVGQVNSQQLSSHNLAERFVKGDDVELHEVMIAGEKAKTSLDLLVEIRNKTIDMYRELTRLQG
ncbi:MAG: flagellar hook-basal body complex protein FliE [bacterium]